MVIVSLVEHSSSRGGVGEARDDPDHYDSARMFVLRLHKKALKFEVVLIVFFSMITRYTTVVSILLLCCRIMSKMKTFCFVVREVVVTGEYGQATA